MASSRSLIVLDSDRMEARLPPDKVQRLTSCFTEFKGRRSCTLKELQSLIGSLNFACKVIPPGRPFLQRMIQLTRNVSLPHHRIKLSKGFFKDLRMWEDFICNWNGAGLFLCLLIGSFQMSCLCTQMPLVLWDLGAFFKPTGFRAHKKPHKKTRSARDLHCMARIVWFCHLLANFFSNKRIQFFCDNESVSVLLTQRYRIPRVMDRVRHLTLLTLRFNFCIRAEHIEGKRNDIADSLSSLSNGSVQGASTP